jgi:hypothetical protein
LEQLGIESELDEIIEPDGVDENGIESDDNYKDMNRDIHLIKVIKKYLDEDLIKRQVLSRLDYLFSDGPDPWEFVADSESFKRISKITEPLNSKNERTYTYDEMKGLVSSETTQNKVPLKECPECGMILCIESGKIICKNCGHGK